MKKGDVSKSRPFHERSYPHPNGIFRFEVNKGETHTFYLAFKNLEQSILPLYIVRATQLSAQLKTEYLVVGVISGILIIMFVYNLFVYISVKDRNYLYYIIYILFLGLTQISITGVTYQYLWPNWHWIAIRSSTLFPSIAGFFGFVFAISFLNLENYLKKGHICCYLPSDDSIYSEFPFFNFWVTPRCFHINAGNNDDWGLHTSCGFYSSLS